MVTQSRPDLKLLKDVKLLKSFTDPELMRLTSVGETIAYEPHTNIVIEGELSWGLYLILEGQVAIIKTNKLTGDQYDVGQLGEGNFFGEMSLVDEDPRSATVKSVNQVTTFYISKEAFLAFLQGSSDLKLRFYLNTVKNLVGRLRELDDNYVISQYQLWESALKKENP